MLPARAAVLLLLLACLALWSPPAIAGALAPSRHAPGLPTSSSRGPRKPVAPQATIALPPSTAYVLVDVGTGNVLAADNEHVRLPPASLTKVLTALIAVSYLPGRAGVPGTKESLEAYPNDVGIQKGVAWPLHDVLESLLVLSANDAAYALAQRISGSLAAFATVMQQSAKQIGMNDAPVFHDPAGLDGTEGFQGGNLVSARDLAIAGRDLLDVPELAHIVIQDSYHFVDPTGAAHYLPSMNNLFLESYPGAIGIKTGFTDKAGSCIMAAARRQGRTMLAVVMNGYNPTQSAMDLLNQGFQTPVASEPTTDRLPPPALPSPVPLSTLSLHHPLSHRARSSHRLPSRAGTRSGGVPAPQSLRRAGPVALGSGGRAVGARGAAASRHGLSAVLDAWPAQVLLYLAAAAALFALWELWCLQQLNDRGRRRPQRSDEPGMAPTRPRAAPTRPVPMNSFGGGRRRREQLVASYRRHEHP
jgi:D-alanyl-D-alanine carboxypeptidase